MLNAGLSKQASDSLLQEAALARQGWFGTTALYFSGIFFLFCFAEGTLILPLVCLFVCIFPSRKPIADPATVIPLFCKAGVDTHVGAGVVTGSLSSPIRCDCSASFPFFIPFT